MRRKFLSVKAMGLLVVLLALFMAIGVAEEERTDASGQWKYILEAGGATITGYPAGDLLIPDEVVGYLAGPVADPTGDLIIPGEVDGVPVTGIGEMAFAYFWNGVDYSAIIPEGVVSIGTGAFLECEMLREVVVPDSVKSIGRNAFYKNINGKDISEITLCVRKGSYAGQYAAANGIPYVFIDAAGQWRYVLEGGGATITGYVGVPPQDLVFPGELDGYPVRTIAEWAGDHFRITGVTIPDSVTHIGPLAFSNFLWDAFVFSDVTIPDSVVSIGDFAFFGCDLASVTIPAGVEEIGQNPFTSCPLGSIDVSADNPVYEQIDGVLFDKRQNMLAVYPGGRGEHAYAVPDGVLRVGDGAFRYCGGLTGVSLPDSVTSVGDSAFFGCANIASMVIPAGVTSIGDGAFRWCEGLTELTIPANVIFIGANVFVGCPNLTLTVAGGSYAEQYAKENGIPYILPDESITDAAGQWKYVLENGGATITGYLGECDGDLLIPNELDGHPVTRIGERVFECCTGLTAVTLPESLTGIGKRAFYECAGLTAVTFPDSVTDIGRSAFAHCEGLTGIAIPEGVLSISSWTFSFCSGLTSVTLPESLTSIEAWAFTDCVSLTDVTLPNSIESIDDFAFGGCESLTGISLPEGLTYIGEYAFASCPNLTDIIIPDSVADIIGEGLFTGEPPPG